MALEAAETAKNFVGKHVELAEIEEAVGGYKAKVVEKLHDGYEFMQAHAGLDYKAKIREFAIKAALAELKKHGIDEASVKAKIKEQAMKMAKAELHKRGIDADNLEA